MTRGSPVIVGVSALAQRVDAGVSLYGAVGFDRLPPLSRRRCCCVGAQMWEVFEGGTQHLAVVAVTGFHRES